LWDSQLDDINGLVFVVDASDPDKFPEAKKEFDLSRFKSSNDYLRLYKLLQHESLQQIPVICCINKVLLIILKVVQVKIRKIFLIL
jgi:signal recognition particle receptor subunit beta